MDIEMSMVLGASTRIHISEDRIVVSIRLQSRGPILGFDSHSWMTLADLVELRDKAQVAIHIMREHRGA